MAIIATTSLARSAFLSQSMHKTAVDPEFVQGITAEVAKG